MWTIAFAIENYMLDHDEAPPDEGWFETIDHRHLSEYDPWGGRYVYRRALESGGFTLRSAGVDGLMGTVDDQIYRDLASYERCGRASDAAADGRPLFTRLWDDALRWWRSR